MSTDEVIKRVDCSPRLRKSRRYRYSVSPTTTGYREGRWFKIDHQGQRCSKTVILSKFMVKLLNINNIHIKCLLKDVPNVMDVV